MSQSTPNFKSEHWVNPKDVNWETGLSGWSAYIFRM